MSLITKLEAPTVNKRHSSVRATNLPSWKGPWGPATWFHTECWIHRFLWCWLGLCVCLYLCHGLFCLLFCLLEIEILIVSQVTLTYGTEKQFLSLTNNVMVRGFVLLIGQLSLAMFCWLPLTKHNEHYQTLWLNGVFSVTNQHQNRIHLYDTFLSIVQYQRRPGTGLITMSPL